MKAFGLIRLGKTAGFFAAVLLLSACGGSDGHDTSGTNPQVVVPPVPGGLTATGGSQQVSLSWTASTGATSYRLKRSSTQGGTFTQITMASATSFMDTGLANGTTYFYEVSALNSAGESADCNPVSATTNSGLTPPAAPTGLSATAGDQQVSLSWNASSGATSYYVKRSGVSGGPYSQVAAPSSPSDSDTGLVDGTAYFYVVSAVNAAGESANSAQVSVTPVSANASVHVTVDVLSNRHAISPLIYGVSFPPDTNYITDSGATLVRWGGNAATRYNWQNFDTNAASDWYFSNRTAGNPPLYADSAQFVSNIAGAGGFPLMTIGMLPWVAKDASSYSFSVAKYGAQCGVNPFNSDDGNGVATDCQTNLTGNDPKDAHVPLLDQPGNNDPAGSVYRSQWVAALAKSFGTAPHYYDMDNEIDIWGSTHRDVHPNPSGYEELRDTFLTEAHGVKTWDPSAVRFGPVSCCWWFYWNGANNNDKAAHGGVDFLPWFLNEVYWRDQISGTRSLDVLDIHSYPDSPSTSGWTQAQIQALDLRLFRDWWDPTYVSESGSINQPWATQTQPNKTIPFRIPRMRALVNTIYPGTPLSMTEWNVDLSSAENIDIALADADAYGIMGRERVTYATRWVAPDSAHPTYQALKLFRNYDGQHHGFGTMSVSATHDANPDLFSSYAALNSTGTMLTVLVLNKDPQNTVQAQVALNGFTPSQATKYTLSGASPTSIVASPAQGWSGTVSLAPYSATLFVITGTMAKAPGAEWDLNPDNIMVPAGGTVTLAPRRVSGSGTVMLTSAQSDSGINVVLTQPNVTSGQNGTITVTAGSTPGFFHYTVTGVDSSGVSQDQSGWIVVGNPAATLTKSGDNQSGVGGSNLTLTVTLNAAQSGGNAQGASIFFTADGGTLSSRIVPTNSSGNASVVLTLPNAATTIHVTAEGPIGLGQPQAIFTENSQ